MKGEELVIDKLKNHDYQSNIYIHNEIFQELKAIHNKGSSHVAFAYSFYYLICYLYRYTKYSDPNIYIKSIKEILGYNRDNKKIDYLIKNNGVLDELGLTYSSTDYPITWSFVDGELEFFMLSQMDTDFKQIINKGRNTKIKVPVKAIHRNGDIEILDGTFYEIEYTHEIPFVIFSLCMKNKELGCNGFYLYGYLKYRCDKFIEYNSSLERIGNEIGMSKNTVDKYLTNLCQFGIIKRKDNKCKLLNGEYYKKANTYSINLKG